MFLPQKTSEIKGGKSTLQHRRHLALGHFISNVHLLLVANLLTDLVPNQSSFFPQPRSVSTALLGHDTPQLRWWLPKSKGFTVKFSPEPS